MSLRWLYLRQCESYMDCRAFLSGVRAYSCWSCIVARLLPAGRCTGGRVGILVERFSYLRQLDLQQFDACNQHGVGYAPAAVEDRRARIPAVGRPFFEDDLIALLLRCSHACTMPPAIGPFNPKTMTAASRA